MKKLHAFFVALAFVGTPFALSNSQNSQTGPPTQTSESKTGREYSGMYSFLKDGEFIQITVEDQGLVTGFVSRYGESASDKGAFLDQYFRSGRLEANKLNFVTETVHGVWFEFNGTVERGEGKNPGDEAYYTLNGTLNENANDAEKKVKTRSSKVVFKKFPKDAQLVPAKKD